MDIKNSYLIMPRSLFLKYYLTSLFLILAFTVSAQGSNNKATDKEDTTDITNSIDSSIIAIIPFERFGGWVFKKHYTPAILTTNDIEKIELLLSKCVTDYNNKLLSDKKEHFGIDMTKHKFKRQYVAAVNDKGEKEVWINCFCEIGGDNWKTSIIFVEDGGNCFFNLKVNLTNENCYDLSVNGYA
jgi:hypothetical protein